MTTRRQFLHRSAGVSATLLLAPHARGQLVAPPASPRKIAALVTTYNRYSHADNIVTRFMEGFSIAGKSFPPPCKVGSLYIEQVNELDIGRPLAKRWGIPLFYSIAEALTLGGSVQDTWSNAGTITQTNSTLNIGGTVTAAGLGTITRSGGTVNLIGVLNNAGNTLTLNSTTGPWNLDGGLIEGGTVTEAGGTFLQPTNSGGELTGVVLNGNLDLASASARLDIGSGGLTLSTASTGTGSLLAGPAKPLPLPPPPIPPPLPPMPCCWLALGLGQ